MLVAQLEVAVDLMVTGRYHEAIPIFDQMLVDLRSYFLAQRVYIESIESDLTVCESSAAPQMEPFLSRIWVARSNECGRASEYPIFERAILVKGGADCDANPWPGETNASIITASVLYNKGLIFHVLSRFHEAKIGNFYIQKARSFYLDALKLVHTCSPCISDCFWLKSVLLTNLGQICSHVYDRSGEQMCLLEIAKLISCRLEDVVVEGGESDLNLNVVLLFGAHRPAPAA